MRNHKLGGVFITMTAALLLAACGKTATTEAAKGNPEGANGPASAITVKVVNAAERDVNAAVQVTGSFVARDISDVAPLSGGRLAQTPVDVGAFVQQGQIIARLEDGDAQTAATPPPPAV